LGRVQNTTIERGYIEDQVFQTASVRARNFPNLCRSRVKTKSGCSAQGFNQ
jgi:hypothetical protein